jgi:hypothetical protein
LVRGVVVTKTFGGEAWYACSPLGEDCSLSLHLHEALILYTYMVLTRLPQAR